MNKKHEYIRYKERGNVLWFILVAIVMLSALTVLLSRSGSSVDQSGDVEQLRIKANQLMRYGSSFEKGIDRLKIINNCSENDISFKNSIVATYNNTSSPADNSCHIFKTAGAGLQWRTFATDELNAGGNNMAFINSFRIEDIGYHTAISGSDLLMVARVSKNLCDRINMDIGLSTTAAEITVSTVDDWNNFFVGTFTDGHKIETAGDATGLIGAQTGCMIDNNGHHIFYHVVLVR